MADPAALADPGVAAGLIAALGAIGLTIRSRLVARRPIQTDEDRQLWFTRAAVAATERALLYDNEDDEEPVLDLRPPYLRGDIDLTEPLSADRQAGPGDRTVELDLSNDAEPTIGLEAPTKKQTTEPPGNPS